jgi:3-dehydroquinate dehydratase-2
MKILIIHGPNLNLLGEREPEKYGHAGSEDIVKDLKKRFPEYSIDYFQSNMEGELVSAIQEAGKTHNGILINPAAFSHSSVAMADAVRAVRIPCICIHITNIYQRESYRRTDLVGEACAGAIVGLGIEGYGLAMECLADHIRAKSTTL